MNELRRWHTLTEGSEGEGRLILPALVLAASSIDPPSLIVNISLIEIAQVFGVSISLAGQIQSINSVLGVAFALLIGAVSVRYRYRTLLVGGLVINLASAAFCTVAPNFTLLISSFAAMGLVSALVTPMVYALIGELYPTDQRTKKIGVLAALRSLIYLAMVQLIGYVVGHWGWRSAFLFLVIPLASIASVSTLRLIPDVHMAAPPGRANTMDGYRGVWASRSAMTCLFGNFLSAASWMGVVMYSVSYLRDRFLLPISAASLIFSGLVVGVIVGNYTGGNIAARYSRKRTLVLSSLLTGVLIVAYLSTPSVSATLLVVSCMSVTGGVVLTLANSLVLDQVPSYRGTVMSANSAAAQLGTALGASAAGLALHFFGWLAVGVILSVIQMTASVIYQLGVKEEESMR